ncbi:glycosyltransferase [Conyzicola sp.]|uniref:glycosyltransferase n=1 Tax=Conyzicola sp. TaxID=1969404 RepID=UPI003988D113
MTLTTEELADSALGRLVAVAPHLLAEPGDLPALRERGAGPLTVRLVEDVRATMRNDQIWLLCVGLTGTFPLPDQLRAARRALLLSDADLAFVDFLEATFDLGAGTEGLASDIEIVHRGVVVDVDFCATHLAHTGIQRVVRQTMARWHGVRDVTLVGWTPGGLAMRGLSALETSRVTAWNTYTEPKSGETVEEAPTRKLLVPYESRVILPEVPQPHLCGVLASLAEFSGNRVGLIGYDAIPVVSADTVPPAETERFVHYLTIIKHSHRVAGISAAATDDFRGFSQALEAQGLPVVESVEVSLPIALPDLVHEPVAENVASPLVLCVGSQEPRKNQDAVLFAAEVLWRENLDFRVRFIGGGSAWFTQGFDQRIKALTKKGYDVEVWRGVRDDALLASYAEARFSIFPSLHEGYGLPVAESLAMGVPVVTSGYGSTAEIAAGGGCVLIDPRDEMTIVDAMRSLISGTDRIEELREQIATRPSRSWDDYADELWNDLVVPLEDGARA